ncbi:hypothetical protein CQ13_35570 [Bradyrhizobium retamae]|uniref:Uncharacterized protein n=1 Tax=Bradyrhizobium retamae TaxID=1300035 RepID=A0A0R3MCJ7_9BRAD|nr:hypothetical protein CQ13_35570 [Bradyrhizobium retamae]
MLGITANLVGAIVAGRLEAAAQGESSQWFSVVAMQVAFFKEWLEPLHVKEEQDGFQLNRPTEHGPTARLTATARGSNGL